MMFHFVTITILGYSVALWKNLTKINLRCHCRLYYQKPEHVFISVSDFSHGPLGAEFHQEPFNAGHKSARSKSNSYSQRVCPDNNGDLTPY